MNENYKLITISLSILIVILLNVISYEIHQKLNEITDNQKQLLEKIDKRNQLDSLYREHLEQCSFISKKEVAIDSRGYFYSTYKNKH